MCDINPDNIKMDSLWKDRWIKALRSGDYVQGKHALEKDGCNCCLGVLAVIGGLESRYSQNETRKQFKFGKDWHGGFPVGNFYGIPHKVMMHLVAMNDDGFSFEEIADAIEGNL